MASPLGERTNSRRRIRSALRNFLENESAAGLVLMAVALLAILTANSPLASTYFAALHIHIGPLSLLHWINDGLMAIFFLVVGLEIKREMLEGQLSSWSHRLLPGAAAAGGMVAPALIYLAFNHSDSNAARGWAIPSATDIAFALGVMSLLGKRIPASLKIFLAALAIMDDLGAVVIIAAFYTQSLSLPDLAGAGLVVVLLFAINRAKVMHLAPYLLLGVVLWVLVLRSGVHATIAGVLLALMIPLKKNPAAEAKQHASPLQRLEHALHLPSSFVVVPVFGFANAGVSFAGVTPAILLEPLTLGLAGGLVMGKLVGVLGAVVLMVRGRLAALPAGAGWGQMFGVALLCGIGFTMSLFIGMLAFEDPALQDRVKFGILLGSGLAGLAGYGALRLTHSGKAAERPVI